MSTPGSTDYNMIIDMDLLSHLRIDIKFSSHTLTWNDTEIPIQELGKLCNRLNSYHSYYMTKDITATNEMTQCTLSILDAKYEQIDIDKVMSEKLYLGITNKGKLKKLLQKYKH